MKFPECTGFENTPRRCWWCGAPLPGRRRRYCSDMCGEAYLTKCVHPLWWTGAEGAAVPMALRRAGYQCQEHGGVHKGGLEVHHIIPLGEGERRHKSPKNNQVNLIVLCTAHHKAEHAAMRAGQQLAGATRGRIYLHNGRIAWALVQRIGEMYRQGAYLTPPGWAVARGLDGSWRADEDGYIVRQAAAVAAEVG